METAACADRDQVRAYILGALEPNAAAWLEDHLSDCETCQAMLETVESFADELIVGLREAQDVQGQDQPHQDQWQVARLIDLVRSNQSTRDLYEVGRETDSDLGDSEPVREAPRAGRRPDERPPVTLADFRECLLASGLFTPAELQPLLRECAKSGQPVDAVSAARWMVERGQLTCFQAAELCHGRSRNLLLGDYLILDEIGRGGMGSVYRARNVRMDRQAAVKVLLPHLFELKETRERFRRETRAIARLSHPNVVAAYSAGERDDCLYLAMEYVEGLNLGALIKIEGPLPVGRAVDYVRQAARGLAAAHEQKIIHRDVKPTNLLISRAGTVKVSDLGLARSLSAAESEDELTETGQILGTCDYVSPEQVLHTGQADERSDIYSLGWTLYHLLTGESPFPALNRLEKLTAHRDAPIPSLRDRRGDIPESLDQLFQRMVAKQPKDRPQSMDDLVEALSALDVDDVEMEQLSLPDLAGTPDLDAFFEDLRLQTQAERRRRAAQQRLARRRTLQRIGAAALMLVVAASALAAHRLLSRSSDDFVGSNAPSLGAPSLDARTRDAGNRDRVDVEVAKVEVTPQPAAPVQQAKSGNPPAGEPPEGVKAAVEPPDVVDKPAVFASPPDSVNLFGEIGQIKIPQRVMAIALSSDQRVLYAGSSDRNVYAIDLMTGEITGKLAEGAFVGDLALSADGTWLATCGSDRAIRIWDVQTGRLGRRVALNRSPWRLAFSPDSQSLLVSLSPARAAAAGDLRESYALVLLDAASGEVLRKFDDDDASHYWSIAFSPNGELIAAGSQQGPILLLDAANGAVMRRVVGHRGPTHAVFFSADGERLYSGGNGGSLLCHRIADGAALYRRGMRHGVIGIDCDAGERRLLLQGTIDVRLLDMKSFGEQAVTNLHGHTSPLSGLLFLDGDNRAVSASWDGTIRIWRLPPAN